MAETYIEKARREGRRIISLGSGLADHWVCTHCQSWSPGEWGETPAAIRHKPNCPNADGKPAA